MVWTDVTEKAKQKFLEKARKLMNKWIWAELEFAGNCMALNYAWKVLSAEQLPLVPDVSHPPHFQGIQIQRNGNVN